MKDFEFKVGTTTVRVQQAFNLAEAPQITIQNGKKVKTLKITTEGQTNRPVIEFVD